MYVSLDGSVSSLDAMFILQNVTAIIDTLPIQVPEEMNNPNGEIDFHEITTNANEFIEIPLVIQEPENIYSFCFELTFESDMIDFIDIDNSNCSELNFAVEQNNDNLIVAGYSIDGNEITNLPIIRFFAPENSQFESSPIKFDRIVWNEKAPTVDAGEFVVINQTATSDDSTPSIVTLKQNYPNPFNPVTTISFSLLDSGFVDLAIYNIRGQKVKVLANKSFQKGNYSLIWDGKDEQQNRVGCGIYFYKLLTNDKVISKKMILLK